jgi:hypothetical protein
MDCWLDGQGFGYRLETTRFSGLRYVQGSTSVLVKGKYGDFSGGEGVKRPVLDFDHTSI